MATSTVDPPAGPRAVHVPQDQPQRLPPRGPQQETRPVGRPRKDGYPAGSAPAPPIAPNGPDDTFWEELDAISKDAWQGNLICYLHRTGPILDLSGGGKAVAIEKITHPFDLAYIVNTHGSGGYRFDISQIPKDGSKQRRIRQSYQTIIDQRYPPKISYGTWIDDARNAEWAWAKPALLEEAQRVAAPAQGQSAMDGVVDALDVVAKIQEISGGKADPSMNGVVLQMLQNNQEALRAYQDPVKQMSTLKALMEMAGGGKQQDSGMSLVVEILRDEVRALRADLQSARAVPQVDPFTSSMGTVRGVLEMLSGLGVSVGGVAKVAAGSGVAEVVGDVVNKVFDKLADATPLIVEGWKHAKDRELQIAMQGGQPGTPQAQPNRRPWEFDPNAKPVAAAAPQPAPAAAPPSPPPVDQPMAQTPQGLLGKYGTLIRDILPALEDHFKNEDGSTFRNWFIDRKGHDLWIAFSVDATPELLRDLTQMLPVQRRAIYQPPEKVLAFFVEMLTGDDDEDEEPPINGTKEEN